MLQPPSYQVSTSSHKVNDNASAQMQKIEHSASAISEMTVTVEEVASNAAKASSGADAANDNATQGATQVEEMKQSIQQLVANIRQVTQSMDSLEKGTNAIGSILDVIDGISEQTNLLALNAAIEAARAGEHGRGFAVVADEVRSLATKTKESTSEIQGMITRLQDDTNESVSLMRLVVDAAQTTEQQSQQASQSFTQVQQSITEIQNMNFQIAASADQQAQAASEINKDVVAINDFAKTTHEFSEVNTDTANQLSTVAGDLKQAVVIFKL